MGDGPTEIAFLGGWLACVMLGHRWQRRDADNVRDHVEYVLRVSWQPADSHQRNSSIRGTSSSTRRSSVANGTRVWLVARRFRDFHALHNELRRSGVRSDTGSSRELPRFPSRHGMASLLLGHNRREAFVARRELLLERYLTDLLALDPGIPSEPAVDRLLELSERLGDVMGERAGAGRRCFKTRRGSSRCKRADSHVEGGEDDGDRDFHNAEWLDYQFKLRLMEMVGDSDEDEIKGNDGDSGRTRVHSLLESVELLRPQLKQAARVPRHMAQATLVLKKFADSLAIFSEIRQRNRRRATC